MSFKGNMSIPQKLPLLITDEILLPNNTVKMTLTSGKDINLVRSLLGARSDLVLQTLIGIIPRKESGDLYDIGTVGVVTRVYDARYGRPYYDLNVCGLCRFRLVSLIQEHPYPVGIVKQLDRFPEEMTEELKETDELLLTFRKSAEELLTLLKIPFTDAKIKEFMTFLSTDYLLDVVAAIIRPIKEEKFKILNAIDKNERAKIIMPHLTRFLEAFQPQGKKGDKDDRRIVRIYPGGRNSNFGSGMGDDDNDFADLESKINEAKVPTEAMKVISKELKRLERMSSRSPEYSMLRSYLELVSDLPWSNIASETCSIRKARQDLEEDHYGMEKVKKRVLEYLAVRQLRGDLKGPILCLTGPPGVGKTSIAKSIASTLGRPFHRISLGGVSDQHDIRGHRRTYIGAMPGRIIHGLKTVKVRNPVFLLDEVDKLSRGLQGDPAAALLEVLDPEQNFAFMDTYLNVPFDLSQVLFVATANTLQTVPSPLLDRMEIISVPGYTQEEKVKIAEYHLVRKELSEHGLAQDAVIFTEDTLKTIIGEYTREAGVRSLQRKIGALCRAVAVKFAEGAQLRDEAKGTLISKEESKDGSTVESDSGNKMINLAEVVEIDSQMLNEVLGPPVFQSGLAGRVCVPGVAIGLAWTPSGGDVLVVEASLTEGESGLILTGQLGKVMQESAKIALSWVRQHAEEFGLEKDFMKCGEIHVHFPAGSIAKDGPSAGVALITVLVSLLSSKCVRPELAMTGEITLNGVVLPVGGIKEKVLAAHRIGLTKVVIPAANKNDLMEVPKSVLDEVEVILVNRVDEVLFAAFEESPYGPLPKEPLPSKL